MTFASVGCVLVGTDNDDIDAQAVAYVAEQVGVPAEEFSQYSWQSRSIEYHRAQIRAAFGFREFSRGEDKLTAWLAEEVCPVELGDERLREAVLVRCHAEGISNRQRRTPADSRLRR